jgi:hypothetical protein
VRQRLFQHLRGSLVAYIALFIALGGTSLAAIEIPRGSVGAPQLKTGAITPAKMNGAEFGGYVRAWAYVSDAGTAYVSHGMGPRVGTHATEPGTYFLLLKNTNVRGCAATASVDAGQVSGTPSGPGFADANVMSVPHEPTGVGVTTYSPTGQATPLPFVVEVVC